MVKTGLIFFWGSVCFPGLCLFSGALFVFSGALFVFWGCVFIEKSTRHGGDKALIFVSMARFLALYQTKYFSIPRVKHATVSPSRWIFFGLDPMFPIEKKRVFSRLETSDRDQKISIEMEKLLHV